MELLRQFTGVFIPSELWEDETLNWTEKCFLGEIEALGGRKKTGCYASNEYLANTFKTTPGNVAVMLSKLRKAGWIKDGQDEKGTRLLFLDRSGPMIVEKPSETPEPEKKAQPKAEKKSAELRLAESIYNTYPRKVGKPDALRKIIAALKKIPFEKLERLTRAYAELWENADKKQLRFCPHPATWFNQERYNDPADSWQGPKEEKPTAAEKREGEKPGASGAGWGKDKFYDGR